MNKLSHKEYDYLKSEVAEIKACITRYVGYSITLTGIATLIAKYYHHEEGSNSEFILIVILIAIILMTFLFEVIWYKFKSHNRYIGYIQLMSQETKHESIYQKSKYKIKNNYQEELEIISWEFVMSRYNNVVSNKNYRFIHESLSKIQFDFVKPKFRDLNKLKSTYNPNKNQSFMKMIQQDYIKSCVYPQYVDNKTWITKPFFILWFSIRHLFYDLWIRPKRRSIRKPIDKSYLSISWTYPKKILQIAFLLFFGLSILFFYFFSIKYTDHYVNFGLVCFLNISDLLSFKNIIGLKLPTILFIIWSIVCFRWLFTYIYEVQDLISGKHSISYFCWLFFIYRVQILNKAGIKPTYFSYGFRRFVKTKFILAITVRFVPLISEL